METQGINDYEMNQNYKSQLFQTDNSQPLSVQANKYKAFNDPEFRNSVGCTESYPSTYKNINEFASQPYTKTMNQEYNKNNNLIKQIPEYNFNSGSVIQNVPTQGKFNGNNGTAMPSIVMEGFGNITSKINDPTNDLLDIDSRPIDDFIHNNMVPFYGGAVKQIMSGTGVQSGNYTEGVDVNSGFDDTTPYQDLLNTYTGMDDTYLHKRATGPMYSPAEVQTGWVHGMPNFRPDEDRYTQSMYIRNDLAPCEQEMVGPGLDIGADIPASGGFHDLTRVLPNNVSDYLANQLEGRVNAGKIRLGGEEPTAYPGVGLGGTLAGNDSAPGVVKNRPDKFWSQVRRPTMTTKVGMVQDQELLRPDYNSSFKPGNAKRSQTNYGFGELVVNGTEKGQESVFKNRNEFNAVPFNDY